MQLSCKQKGSAPPSIVGLIRRRQCGVESRADAVVNSQYDIPQFTLAARILNARTACVPVVLRGLSYDRQETAIYKPPLGLSQLLTLWESPLIEIFSLVFSYVKTVFYRTFLAQVVLHFCDH